MQFYVPRPCLGRSQQDLKWHPIFHWLFPAVLLHHPLNRELCLHPCIRQDTCNLSCLMTKPTLWHVHLAMTQISLGIRPVRSVFAVCMKRAWVLSNPLSRQQRLIRLGGWLWAQRCSDQTGHQPSPIRVFAVSIKKAWVLSYPLSGQRRLIRLGGCPGWSKSSLGSPSFCWFCHEATPFLLL